MTLIARLARHLTLDLTLRPNPRRDAARAEQIAKAAVNCKAIKSARQSKREAIHEELRLSANIRRAG